MAAELERAGALDGPQPGSPYDVAPSARSTSESPSATTAVDRSGILRLLLVSFVAMVAFSGFEATFSLLTKDRFGLSESGTGAVLAVIGLGLVVVQGGLIGRVNERLGDLGTLRAGLVFNGVGLALLAIDGGWGVLTAALALLVLGQGLITPTLSSAVAGRAGDERGAWLGWQQSAGALARVAGPVAAGVLFQHIGLGAPYVAGAVAVLIALTFVPGARAVERH